MIEVNEDAFTSAFIKNLGSKYKISSFSKGALPGEQISQCCSEIVKTLPKEELDNLITESLKSTPAYKSRIKHGFNICDKKFILDSASKTLDVGFTVCK